MALEPLVHLLTQTCGGHRYCREPGLCMHDLVAHIFSNPMTFTGGQILINDDMKLCLELMPEPADADVVGILRPGDASRRTLDAIHQCGIDRIHQPMPHRHRRIFHDKENGDCNQQANDWVCEWEPGQA